MECGYAGAAGRGAVETLYPDGGRRAAWRAEGRVFRVFPPFPAAIPWPPSAPRDHSPAEQLLWRLELKRWLEGWQDPILRESGDRYFEDDLGRTFMHLPDRIKILEDLKATGWRHTRDALRREVAKETRAVRNFSDESAASGWPRAAD
ncbi:MAG: hypothetical protein LBK99_27705 [Opitutaceae bacterium]|nr:hypothetical protein [Opitutaceae bacterium]